MQPHNLADLHIFPEVPSVFRNNFNQLRAIAFAG